MNPKRPGPERKVSKVATADSEATALEVVGLIYDAALRPETWNEVFLKISDAMGGGAAGIFAWDCVNQRMAFDAEVRVDPAMADAYRRYYYNLDPWVERLATLPAGSVTPSDALVPLSKIVRSEFYNDFVVPMGNGSICASTVENDDSITVVASVVRPLGRPAFGEAELRFARLVVPHLRRAVNIFRNRSALECQIGMAEEVQRLASVASVLIGSNNKLLSVSDLVRRIAERRDGIKLSTYGVSGLVPSETSKLNALVHAVIRTSEGGGLHPGGVVRLTRSIPGSPPYTVSVSPLRLPYDPFGQARAAAVLLISDPERLVKSSGGQFAALYGLTNAEARLADAISNGLSVADAADSFGITVATARTQLKAIFQKTGCRRQAELVRLRLSFPG